MTFSDLHPEELLCPSGSRTLTADETADLNAHLARCPACLLQLQLGPEIERALPPTEQDYVLAARVAERVLAMSPSTSTATATATATATTAGTPTATATQDGTSSGWAARLMDRRGLWSRVAIVLFFLLGTGMGAQAIVVHLRDRAARSASDGSAAGLPTAPVRAKRRPAERAAEAPPMPEPSLTPPVVPSPPLQPAASPSISPSIKKDPTETKPRRSPRVMEAIGARPEIVIARAEPGAGGVLPAPSSAPIISPPPPSVSRADSSTSLFRRAERARLDGDLPEANRLFRALGLGFAGSREEVASRVLFGQLLLDELHSPSEALAAFDRYLRDEPAGTLAEEARVGRAQALRQMGRPHDELAAWRDLLAHHPASVHAAAARARLSQLSAIH